MDTFTPSPEADVKRNILWQYEQAQKFKSLITKKQEWLDINFKAFFESYIKYFFGALVIGKDEAQTLADAEPGDEAYRASQIWQAGLAAWGKILNLPRTYISGGTETQISTILYFILMKGELLKQNMGSSVPEINRWLRLMFGYFGIAYAIDNGNMTIYIVIDFAVSADIYNMLLSLDIIPRPCGVGIGLINYSDGMVLWADEFEDDYTEIDDGTLAGEDNEGTILAPYAEL